jgi:hypothetical protein
LSGAPKTITRTVVVVPTTLMTPPVMLLPGTLAEQLATFNENAVLLKEMSLPPAATIRPEESRVDEIVTMPPGRPTPDPRSM